MMNFKNQMVIESIKFLGNCMLENLVDSFDEICRMAHRGSTQSDEIRGSEKKPRSENL